MKQFTSMSLIAICLIGASRAAADPPSAAERQAADTSIRASAESFAESFRKRDAAAIAAHWLPDGVYTNEDGERFEGRKALQSEYETLFKNITDDVELKLEIDSIRLVSSDTAIEEGRAALTPQPTGDFRVMSRYTAVHVKQGDEWFMADVRDTRVELPPDAGQVEDLEWLVGTWTGGTKENHVISRCRWIENQHFLARSYSVTEGGKETSTGLQIIGLDPSTGRITSWTFASDGGHAVGIWSPHQTGWVIQSSGAVQDGTETGAVQILSRQDQDTLTWKSVDRTLGDDLLPDLPEVTLKRR